MKKWRFLSLSMPILVALLFGFCGEGPDRKTEKSVKALFSLPISNNLAPDWGVIEDRGALQTFMRDFFSQETVPDVDFDRSRVLFLLNGPEGGQYAGFQIQAYREDSGGGITVFCEKRASSPSGQLVVVPRFQGEALFFFR